MWLSKVLSTRSSNVYHTMDRPEMRSSEDSIPTAGHSIVGYAGSTSASSCGLVDGTDPVLASWPGSFGCVGLVSQA